MVLIQAYQRTVNPIHRRQLKLFIIALSQYITVGLLFDAVIYTIDPNFSPPMAFAYTTTLSLIIGYGILRHGLFNVSPAALSEPILQNLAEGILGLNRDYIIEFSNVAARQIFGQDESKLQGRGLRDLFKDQDRRRIAGSDSLQSESTVLEDIVALGPNSRKIPVTVTISHIRDDRGAIGGHILVIQNITELKQKTLQLAREKTNIQQRILQRTAQLHDERTKLQASIESLTVGFVLFDVHDNVVTQNSALRQVVAASDVIKDVKDLSSHLDGARLPDILLGARQAGRAGITKELSAGGKIFRVFATAVASQEASAAAIGTVMIIEDITEIKVRERSRDEFFSIASHELRTPLTAIRGNATMIADYYGAELKSPDLKAMIDDIHESSVRLIEIVNDFLDLSGLEQGKIVFDLKACALEPLLESVAYEMKSVLRSKQLYLKLDPLTLDALPKVWVDENRTKQVIYNLIGNAAKFTDSGGVTVTASTSGGFVKVVVTDTGQGIEKESRKLLFRKFQQAGSSILTRDSTRGTGLGLYISKLIVERMGGKIGLRSTAAGKGSSFYFTLPIAPR